MLRARAFSLIFASGAVAVAACASSGDDGATGGAGHASALGGSAGTTAGRAGNRGTSEAAGGSPANGAVGGMSRGGTGGAATSNAGTSGSAGAASGASTTSSGGANSGAGASGHSGGGRSGGASAGGTNQGARGGTSGRGNGASGAAGDGDAGTSGGAVGASGSDYDAVVLADGPVLYFAMNGASHETDLTGNGHDGSYAAGAPARAALPNGDDAADFDGVKQYLTVPSAAVLSIPTTHELTWEAWIRPDVLEFTHETSDGYVDWLGKCAEYAPSCEWEARLYSMTNSENRCNRLSAYAFNPDGDLGSGAFWQQTDCGASIQANSWYHVVGEYTTLSQPAACDDTYPGAIDIWVNGVRWQQASHGDTGCMSQYQIVPVANDSPLNIGTMAKDSWFAGAVGKVAIYDKQLSDSAIMQHYAAMTSKAPTGSCADTCSF